MGNPQTLMPPDPIESTRAKLTNGMLAGFLATLLMTALLLLAPALTGSRLPAVLEQAFGFLRAHPLWGAATLASHLVYGSLAGGLFAVGARRITVNRGLLYGLGLWGVAFAVYAPLVGLGFLGKGQPALAVLAIPAHLLYGIAVGALGPRGEIVQPIGDRPLGTLA
jgi:hypothetical protein